MEYEDILRRFKIKSRYQNKAQAYCPAHEDNIASLTITQGDKGTLIFCHAQCKTEDILQSVGLKKSDLFYDKKPSGSRWRKYIENREGREIEAVYHYHFFNGNYAFTKIRLRGKKMLYGKLENDKFTYGLGGTHRKDLQAVYGSVQALNKAITDGKPIFYCEGEKDVNTLQKHGYAAITAGGVNDWKQDMAQLFKGADTVILADNDEPGKKLANRIKADLQGVAKSVKIIVPCPDLSHGDISDFFADGHNKEDFERLISEKPVTKSVQENNDLVDRLTRLKAVERFATNDKGSAELFAAMFGYECRYNPTQKDFMYFNGIKWESDLEGMRAKKNAKRLADALLRYAVSVDGLDDKQRQEYLKYSSRLMTYRDRNTMVNDSKDLNFFDNEQLDKDDYLLNCKNCVLDLSGDHPKVLEHNADLLLSKACNADYNPAATCHLWKKTIYEIMEGDQEKIRYLQKIFGLSLTGCTAEEELYFFYGGSTRNGKSTLCETALYILGDYAESIMPETLAIKPNKDSRTASPDIAKLAGARLVIASEPPKRMLFDTSLVKTLTGRDRITARFLHQNEFSFTPRFKLILNTNYLPTITDNTVFKSERIRVVNFSKHFEANEQNKRLKDELKEEASGILNWFIEGLYLYKREGLNPPQAVTESTGQYEADSDKIGRFLSECMEQTDKNTSAKIVYEAYSKWCTDSGYGIESKGNFFSELKVRGLFSASGTVNGKTVKNVVKGYKPIDEDFMQVDENFKLPFS